MRTRYLSWALSVILLSAPCAAQLPPPTEIMTSNNEQVIEHAAERSLIQSIDLFTPLYNAKGQPRIAILWNLNFDSVASDWELSPAQLKYAESLRIKTNEKELHANYERQITEITRSNSSVRSSPIEIDFEHFKTSFIDTMLQAKVNLVDRDTIIRLKGVTEDQNNTTYQLDRKKLETQALMDFSEYVMELLFIPTPKSALGYSASVEITDITTGQTIAKLISFIPKTKYKETWQASASGFEIAKTLAYTPSFEQIGQDMAIDTINKLASRWQ